MSLFISIIISFSILSSIALPSVLAGGARDIHIPNLPTREKS
jgi:hypothetical protein